MAKQNNETGLTFWDFLFKIFKDTKTFLVTLAILLILIVVLLLFGYIGYNSNGFHIGKTHIDTTTVKTISFDCLDKDMKFCVEEAKKRNLDYVTENILINVDADKIGKDSLIEKVRIAYTIHALKDLHGTQFTEKYQTTSNAILKHVFGTDKEELSGKGNVFDIILNMDVNNTKTILTGCDYYFNLPLPNNRNEVAGDMPVNSTQDVYIYPNDEDVIKSITIRIASNNINIRPIVKGARRYRGENIIKDDPYLQYDVNGIAKYSSRSISYTWKNILPKERVIIYFEWD